MGWDALRHYEVLARGCVPYFVDLLMLPAASMPFYPRDLILEAMTLRGVGSTAGRGDFWYAGSYGIDHSGFQQSAYFGIAAKIQAHARRHLSTKARARYILQALAAAGGAREPRRVLFVHHCYHDFMGDSLWHGFKDLELAGELEQVADVIPPREMSVGGADGWWGKIWWRGDCVRGRKPPLMTSAKTMNRYHYYGWVNGWALHRAHNWFPNSTATDPETVPARIRAKEFDAVVYAAPQRTLAWVGEVTRHYPRNRIAFISGSDAPDDFRMLTRWSAKATVFARELYDEPGVPDGVEGACHAAPGVADDDELSCCLMSEVGETVLWSYKRGDPARWRACGKEREFCNCSTEVRFGDRLTGRFTPPMAVPAGRNGVDCTSATQGGVFQDPALGQPKVCHCRIGCPQTVKPPGAPSRC
eukprot:TRINITY_DN29979_c0_g1_i2.p1 TRINITY_DN29979_c0_g1~~TRINITY_DN29979_c0_g1_i2.p1  ORF type:complete len:416 (+),score=87.89 TRINITY_DN29979_c0_g1_i2:1033-2280(+)